MRTVRLGFRFEVPPLGGLGQFAHQTAERGYAQMRPYAEFRISAHRVAMRCSAIAFSRNSGEDDYINKLSFL